MVNGIGIEEHDQEGRVITAEYDNFYLVTCYTPNSQRELAFGLPYDLGRCIPRLLIGIGQEKTSYSLW